ncbi:MAG TPA: PKD domain-containing protein [Candidatus Bipolaricaulis sp.]|nr:PKD domain-containing protein [Candidatus Bipolaricaulis sp.]
MRRSILLAVAVALTAPVVWGQVGFTNIGLSDEFVAPGAVVLAQIIQFTVPTGSSLKIESITVRNTAQTESRVLAADIDFIEIRKTSETGSVLKKVTSIAGTGFEDGTGLTIGSLSNNTFSAGTHRIYILVRLKTGVALGKTLQLGKEGAPTVINKTEESPGQFVDYDEAGQPAGTFTVALPTIAFDGSLPTTADVYRGQRFLAGRIEVNADNLPFESPITQLVIKNIATGPGVTKLAGKYIERIEVRRASDDAQLGTTTSVATLTSTGVVITTSGAKVGPYNTVVLEIWVTVKMDAPTGHKLQLLADVRCGGRDITAGDKAPVEDVAPVFTIAQPSGFENVDNLDVVDGGDPRVFSGQRFLAQRIEVTDDDPDPYNVTVNSLVVWNIAAESRLADSQIARIEIIRARDGALMGSVASASGLSSGGLRIGTGSANVVLDDTTEIIEVWVTLGTAVPLDRKLQLRTVVWHTEDSKIYGKPEGGEDPLDGEVFTTGPAEATGLEVAELDKTLTDRKVFQGVRFLAQRLKLEDSDANPYDVGITSLMVRNAETESPLADQHVARIEVRRKSDGALLGEVTDPVGLSLAGVRVTTSANNVVPDDSTVELEIWITLKDTAPAGRKLQLATVVWHTEGTATYQKGPLAGPATFTTAIGQAPTGVDFSWTPAAPEAGVEITFTPATGIADPSGKIANATFSWNFGDGKTAETKGSAAVKHTYAIGGTYQVTLTVTGEGGLASSKTKPIEVIGKQPVVDFTFTPAEPAAGQAVTFTSQVTDPATPPLTPYTYAWAFGDGGTSTAANPQHTYTAAGTYTVVLSVTNSRGEVGRKEKTITVAASPVNRRPVVTAIAVSPAAPVVGQTITFTATASDSDGDAITGYEWKLGDETVVATTTNTTTRAFTTADVFRIQVRARDAGGFGEWFSLDVYVRPTGGAAVGAKVLDNPARTQCRIQVFLPPGATNVSIQIFDMLGREVRRSEVAGTQFTWDLRDGNGRSIADGLYFYLITATVEGKTERSEIGKILVVR